MTGQDADIARRSAQRLVEQYDETLPAQVEAQLKGEDIPESFADPATIATLAGAIVGVASFAWTVFKDIRKMLRESEKAESPSQVVLERRVRLEFQDPDVPPEVLDRIISVVVEETIKVGAENPGGD